jgi:hypothetical protein
MQLITAYNGGSISSSRCQTTCIATIDEINAIQISNAWTSYQSRQRRLRLPAACQPKLRSSEGWWSQTGSNRRPPACKAGALPTELWPRLECVAPERVVGLGRLELPTSRLSSARSNQLSYKPKNPRSHRGLAASIRPDGPKTRVLRPAETHPIRMNHGAGSSMKEREKKTAVSCQWT